MNIAFNFKNFEPSTHLKEYAAARFEKLGKYVHNQETIEVQVNLSVEKFRQMAEVVISGDNLHLSAYEESEDMYATIDLVLDKAVTQVKKVREKQRSRRSSSEDKFVRTEVFSFGGADTAGKRERTIVQTDQYEPKPLLVDEAAMQLENRNLEFLVFLNAETERINVIYLRNNGDFGLIDPGM